MGYQINILWNSKTDGLVSGLVGVWVRLRLVTTNPTLIGGGDRVFRVRVLCSSKYSSMSKKWFQYREACRLWGRLSFMLPRGTTIDLQPRKGWFVFALWQNDKDSTVGAIANARLVPTVLKGWDHIAAYPHPHASPILPMEQPKTFHFYVPLLFPKGFHFYGQGGLTNHVVLVYVHVYKQTMPSWCPPWPKPRGGFGGWDPARVLNFHRREQNSGGTMSVFYYGNSRQTTVGAHIQLSNYNYQKNCNSRRPLWGQMAHTWIENYTAEMV